MARTDKKERLVPPIRPGFSPGPIKKIIRQELAKGITDSIEIMERLYQHGYNVPLLLVEDFVENIKGKES